MPIVTSARAGGTLAAVPRDGRANAVLAATTRSPASVLAFGFVFLLGVDSGGYSATRWGWAALLLCAAAALAVVLLTELRLGFLELAFAVGLFAFLGWGLSSGLWSASPTEPLLQSQRTLVYVVGAAAALVLARSYAALLIAVWSAIALVCSYGLLTRLVPDRLGFVDTVAGYRLEQPVGYWNALGIYAAMGTLLALGLAARGRGTLVRAAAAASTVPLVSTLYFTYSRGAWLALAAGLVVMLTLDRHRLQLIAATVVVGLWPAIGVWRASGERPLTRLGSSLADAAHAGHRLLVVMVALAAAAGFAATLFAVGERRVAPPRFVRFAFAAAVWLAVVAAVAAAVVRFGPPVTMARHGYDRFLGPSRVITNGNLNQRLFDLSSDQRIPQWRVAWREYRLHPVLGSGLGTYASYWNELRPTNFTVQNVHNLYLETFAELGPVGLALLCVTLLLPVAAALRARGRPLVAAAAGAYVAFLIHAAVDWDWQVPAVVLAAIFTGVALLVAARGTPAALHLGVRTATVAGLVALAVFAFVGLRGNRALAEAQSAVDGGRLSAAVSQATTASRWMPWSAAPWQVRGDPELQQGDLGAARADLRKAAQKDPADWSIWLDLMRATTGAERRLALAHAARLNPLNLEVEALTGR